MSLLSDLVNLNLSDSTDKIIAEYIWDHNTAVSVPIEPSAATSSILIIKLVFTRALDISGINGEVMPDQRITEIAGVDLSFDPKPIQGDWNGAGAHTNYSTKSMRNDGGYEVIKNAIEKLGLRHKEHIAAYGASSHRTTRNRIYQQLLIGVANRGATIRVGRDTENEGIGFFEDRRPASNMDPYVVTSMIAETTIFGSREADRVPFLPNSKSL